MKLNDTIVQDNGDQAVITEAPKPPQKWKIEYTDGRVRFKSKSFLKKYFKVVK